MTPPMSDTLRTTSETSIRCADSWWQMLSISPAESSAIATAGGPQLTVVPSTVILTGQTARTSASATPTVRVNAPVVFTAAA
jgi:hypothetical protein